MSWMDDHYRMDGDLEELSNGRYYDRESDTEYDSRGDKI